MKAELEHLIALQKIDINIRKLEAEIEGIPKRRAEIEYEFDQRAFEIRALESQRDESRNERVRLENELAETKIKAERADRNLMSSKKPEEYTAAIREADSARKHSSQLETQILEKMESFDQAETSLKEREPEVSKLRVEMDERFKIFDTQTSDQAHQIGKLRAERERLLASLPKSLGLLYNRISARIRDGIAVAEARNGSCTACFMSLRPQMMAEVRRGEEVITCDNCSRILYYAPADKKAEESRPSLAPSAAAH